MKGAVAAMAVGGVVVIAGFPTVALVAASNTYTGDESRVEVHGRAKNDGNGLKLGHDKWRELPRFEGRGELLPHLQDWGTWLRCVVQETREDDGAFDPEEVCGALPEELELPGPPPGLEGKLEDLDELREWMRCAFDAHHDGTSRDEIEAECGERPGR